MAAETQTPPIHWETQPPQPSILRPVPDYAKQTQSATPRPKYAKRTQFTPRPPSATPKNTKRTQLTPPRVIPSGGLRSEAKRPKAEGPVKTPSPKAIPNKQPPPHTN